MKKILLVIFALMSFQAFAQSYVIFDNGIVITTDTNGFSYDFGHYAFPQKIFLKGGQYFVEEGGILATIDENGLLFRKYELIPDKIIGKGINYFLSSEGFLYAIDKKGIVKVTESALYKNAVNFGGNYFTVANDAEKKQLDLYVVTADGSAIKVDQPSLNVKDIIAYGGNYLMNNRGIVFTVSSSGTVVPHDEFRVGIIQKRGGNYLIDSSGLFFTVSEAGELLMPALPMNMKINTVLKLGANYFIDQAGKFFVVDKKGEVFERSFRDHDFKLSKVISL
jgi:hypothetical protein